jgi:hypothetical protein
METVLAVSSPPGFSQWLQKLVQLRAALTAAASPPSGAGEAVGVSDLRPCAPDDAVVSSTGELPVCAGGAWGLSASDEHIRVARSRISRSKGYSLKLLPIMPLIANAGGRSKRSVTRERSELGHSKTNRVPQIPYFGRTWAVEDSEMVGNPVDSAGKVDS